MPPFPFSCPRTHILSKWKLNGQVSHLVEENGSAKPAVRSLPRQRSQVHSAGSSGEARVAPKTLRFWGHLCLATATPSFSLTTGDGLAVGAPFFQEISSGELGGLDQVSGLLKSNLHPTLHSRPSSKYPGQVFILIREQSILCRRPHQGQALL